MQSRTREQEKRFFLGLWKARCIDVLFGVFTKLGHIGMVFFAHERRSVRNIVLCHDCMHCPGFIDASCHASTLELFLIKKGPFARTQRVKK